MSDARRPALLAAAGALLVASAAGVTLWQLSRVLWGVLNSSYEETQRAMVACTARINSDSPDEDVPEELYLVDDQAGVYVYEGIQVRARGCVSHDRRCHAGAAMLKPVSPAGPVSRTQDLYWRRGAPGAPSDWEWSYDMQEFHSTDDLAMVRREARRRHGSTIAAQHAVMHATGGVAEHTRTHQHFVSVSVSVSVPPTTHNQPHTYPTIHIPNHTHTLRTTHYISTHQP
jgi:hypothetical protein